MACAPLSGKSNRKKNTVTQTPLDIARNVISLEIEGLEKLKSALGGEFNQAVQLMRGVTGRVVVTGMGKSGHVARKIAATLASTGAPAMFVHPGEASHGDLGMISANDAILALSKSGETGELGDLLGYAARFSIPVIAITGCARSSLAQAATAAIAIPDATEACGETRAPTTSTTMMMALGDALAVALLRERGFTADDFKGFHPGGSLGAALRRVEDLMHGPDHLPICEEGSVISDVVTVITKHGYGCAGVVDDKGALIGIITDGDLRRKFDTNLPAKSAGEVMTKTPRTTTRDALAGDILAMMSTDKITAIFVVDNDRPVGIVHVHDCLTTGVL